MNKLLSTFFKKDALIKQKKCCLMMAMVTSFFFMSCAEHDDMFDVGMKVGNILLANNTMVSAESYNPETMKAVGVVFYTSGDTALAVAPVELGDYCFSDSIGTISGVSTDSYSLDGLTSTAALITSKQNVPAAEACVKYHSPLSGWFLPSAGELRIMASNLGKVQKSMKIIGGTDFDDVQYMSSSQDNSSSGNSIINCYCVSLLKGYAVSVPKNESHRVRPVILVH